MLQLRPYTPTDATTILSWCTDEIGFYQWTAGVLGAYPLSEAQFNAVTALMPFTAVDERGIAGFFTLRKPRGTADELRFGFVIVAPALRGRGYGKAMLRLGLHYVFERYGAQRVSLGVFENNPAAYRCYKAAGFSEVAASASECYRVLGEEWRCVELAMEKAEYCQSRSGSRAWRT